MSEGVLVDSDILIEILRDRNAEIREGWRRLEKDAALIACSPITVAEVWHGARDREADAILGLFLSLTCIPIDGETGRLAGLLLKRFRPGHGLRIADALIAATARIHQLQLWTCNRKHYPMRDLEFY